MRSIRRQTSLLVAVSIAGLLALGGVTLYVVVRTALTRQFDDGLAARAAALQSLTRSDAGTVEMDIVGEVMPRYLGGADAEYFVAWTREGDAWRVLEQSESLRAGAWPLAAGAPLPLGTVDCALPDRRAGRARTIEFQPVVEHDGERERDAAPSAAQSAASAQTPGPVVRVLVAQSRGLLDRTLWTVAFSIGGVGLALVLASIAATRWAVRRGTRPLESLSAQVAALGPETLDQRLGTERLPIELAPVAARLNDLLARLSEAFDRERRFTSAASHELRTPIAELRMLLEVGLSRDRTPDHWAKAARDGLGVLDRAQRLTDALLRLSRAGPGNRTVLPDATIDLAVIVREQAARALNATGHDRTQVIIHAPVPLPARIDPALAASIIGNLFDNALRHGDVGADRPVRCVCSSDAAGVLIVISNHAPGLSHSDIAHLFEPFWRKDAARDACGGFGLGLAVGRTLASSFGGQLTAAMDEQQELFVTLKVPA